MIVVKQMNPTARWCVYKQEASDAWLSVCCSRTRAGFQCHRGVRSVSVAVVFVVLLTLDLQTVTVAVTVTVTVTVCVPQTDWAST